MPLNFNKAEFVRSAGEPKDFLRDGLPQFAFAGRSNVGKSSVINRLVGRKNLAYVGASPGKTTHINYFLIDQKAYLVDLPGYGYAKVSRSEKERWARLMETYFQREADAITTGVLIVDIRHKPTDNDLVMHDWFRQRENRRYTCWVCRLFFCRSGGKQYAGIKGRKRSENFGTLPFLRE